MKDTEISRGLYRKAIELDDNLIEAKTSLGWTYFETGDYDKAMEIYTSALKQAEELGNKSGIGASLKSIGDVHQIKGDIDTAIDYYGRQLKITEELGDKYGIGASLNNIGGMYLNKGDYEKALDYYERSLAIDEELGDKRGMGISLNNIGLVHSDKGDYEKALDYYKRSLAIDEELGDKRGMGGSLNNIGIVCSNKGDYEKAEEYLEKSLGIHKEIGLGADDLIWSTTYLYLTYKHLGKDYDEKEIHTLIKETENIEFGLNYTLYQLLEDKTYLETAYNQIQRKAGNLKDKAKFLSYPIPKTIVEEWEKTQIDSSG
jgi:tetratricopeptide (TPR) repeat protein